MTYVRPVGKAYVVHHPTNPSKWVVCVQQRWSFNSPYREVTSNWRDALDTALWYNETYYHPTDKEN